MLFTVGEESGQKGSIRAPIGRILAGKVRFGIEAVVRDVEDVKEVTFVEFE